MHFKKVDFKIQSGFYHINEAAFSMEHHLCSYMRQSSKWFLKPRTLSTQTNFLLSHLIRHFQGNKPTREFCTSTVLMAEEKQRVCVTGAGGYVASWLVKLLLSKGYIVHGTVRDPRDEKKNGHLTKLKKASENLKLFKADLLNYDSLCAAIQECTGVFHVACPVPSSTTTNPEVDILAPAVTGTLNVLKACSEARVKRVVFVSSVAAVGMNPEFPKDQVMDEACWSNKEYCRETKNWYCLAKTEAEMEAFEYANKNNLDVVAVCPSLVIGPMLQSTMNASSLVLVKILKDGLETMENKVRIIVDVRDVADALLLTYEKPVAEGRYICAAHLIRARDLVQKLRKLFPNYNYPKSFTEVEAEEKLSSEKLQKLGWRYRPLEETLVDSVKSYQEFGLLGKD